MKVAIRQRNIWKNLGLALVTTPAAGTVGLIFITLIGGLDDAITKLQRGGRWWILLIITYLLSLIYFFYEPKIRRNHLRNKYASALILYWEGKLAKEGKPQPSSDRETECMRDLLDERIKAWAWSDPDLWSRYYPNEKYSENPFEIVDGIMAWFEEKRELYKNK